MRILHINPLFDVIGGTESYLFRLIRDLEAAGHTSMVAAEEDRTDGSVAPFFHLPEIFAARPRWTLRLGPRLWRILRQARPHVVHVHNVRNPELLRLVAALKPTVRSVHDHVTFCPGLNKLYADETVCTTPMGKHCLEKYHQGGCYCLRFPTLAEAAAEVRHTARLLRAHRRVRRILVASQYMRAELLAVGLPTERIEVLPYYLEFGPLNSAPELSPPLILTLARLSHPDKGILPLLAALARIQVPYQAWIVGDGQHREMIEARWRELRLQERVRLLGWRPHAEAVGLIARARVVAFPSVWQEPFGIVGLEAMAYGKPVVAFDVGGVREWLVPGETGLVVPRGDVAAYARALTELLVDGDRARRLGAAGRARLQARFTREGHVERLVAIYAEAFRRGPRLLLPGGVRKKPPPPEPGRSGPAA